MFPWIQRLDRQSRPLLALAAVAIVLTVGAVDYATGREIVFSVFYLLALGLATWFVGRGFAVFIAGFSVAVSFAGNWAAGAQYSSFWVPCWNASIDLAIYIVVVWLLANLRSIYEELEALVRLRTVALTDEMAERERLEQELLEISEREQRRIGHDLHDGLCQHLTAAALAGQVLQEKLTLLNLAESRDAGKVVELVEEGIALSRKLAKGLHPIAMEAGGLMEALGDLTETTSELFKVACVFECDSPVLLSDPTICGHLYRIAQEAISNGIKHGRAKSIHVCLENRDDGVALQIKDDGIGLPAPELRGEGMGLRIMAHRAGMIGAKFSVGREAGRGTLVACLLVQKESSVER